MAELSPHEMASRLLSDGFTRAGPTANALTDPIADTAMVVTLDELRSYELDPRITRNPLYDEIKASIRERGLDAPPPITRRPGADHYIIRNGGNTRLAILRELWTETREERFFRIACLFRPWPERGEIVALTGHLAENELHGGLSFIERALGVAKVQELYEQEDGKALSQSELARRLKADGYPVPQPHISRMQEAVQYLLPAIPNVLFGGLGRPQIEQLTGLRRTGARIWEARSASASSSTDFVTLFQDVLASFDAAPGGFSVQRVQDELVGQMADLLGEKYDTLAFELIDSEKRWQLLSGEAKAGQPAAPTTAPSQVLPSVPTTPTPPPPDAGLVGPSSDTRVSPEGFSPDAHRDVERPAPETMEDETAGDPATPAQDHVAMPTPAADRLQSIQRLVADRLGEASSGIDDSARKTIPVQVDGLYPISDVWHIDPGLGTPDRLRVHIAQFAREIADEAGLAEWVVSRDDGIGFACVRGSDQRDVQEMTPSSRAISALLYTLSAPYHSAPLSSRIDTLHLVRDLGALLLGPAQLQASSGIQTACLSDSGLIKLFRLVRLARRLLELEARTSDGGSSAPGS
ncbi:ParB family protein [Xanthobacter autotrophicus]|uniref:ParB family protein n=1 Tax=Xanthobacter autotrophicus TaxID=280 RepID=UPI00372A583D